MVNRMGFLVFILFSFNVVPLIILTKWALQTPQCWYAMYIAIFVSCHTPHPPSHKSHLILCPTQVQVSSLRIQLATCVTDMQDYIALQGTLPLYLQQTVVFNFYFLFKKPVDITTQVLNCILNRERLLASCVFMSKHSGHHFTRL